jgi:hypothetical protein
MRYDMVTGVTCEEGSRTGGTECTIHRRDNDDVNVSPEFLDFDDDIVVFTQKTKYRVDRGLGTCEFTNDSTGERTLECERTDEEPVPDRPTRRPMR